MRVHLLDEYTINQIAAGEIIESPASIIKELVENSMDADSSAITVEIKDGGIKYIRVTDNGIGMSSEDAKLALLRHATSKISSANDLESIYTLGFRGEALASIAAVTQLELFTRARDTISGTHIVNHGGEIIDIKETGCPEGTTIIVQNLFYNTPARLKFLKSTRAESAKISDIIGKLIMGNPAISIKYINNGRVIYHSPGNGDLLSAIMTVYGASIVSDVIEILDEELDNNIVIKGYLGKPSLSRSNRVHQSFFVNYRYVNKSELLTKALEDAYKGYMTVNTYPWAVLYVTIPPHQIDVNIHPAKTEIRFKDEQRVYELVYEVIRRSLSKGDYIPKIESPMIGDTTTDVLSSGVDSLIDDSTNYADYNDQTVRGNNKLEYTDYNERQTVYVGEQENERACINSQIVEHNIDNNIPYRVIGTLFSTYILVERGENLYIIDQHAAHERILYETFKDAQLKREIAIQMINPPVIIDITHNEKVILEKSLETFLNLGFDIDNFGGNTFIIRGIPAFLDNVNIKELFFDILDSAINSNKAHSYILEEEQIISSACKKAIKAKDNLSDREIMALLMQIEQMDLEQLTCPHGRPIMIRLTQYELEKYFKRVI